MSDETRDAEGPGAGERDADESEYPKAPGASKMEALERIQRSLERQSEDIGERSEADARTDGEGGDADPGRDSGD